MSRPLLKEAEEKELRKLQSSLINTINKTEDKSVLISKKDIQSIVKLIKNILDGKPIKIDNYVTPNEAAKLSDASRPFIVEMLKNGSLLGQMVGSHWRVQKFSLLDYINERDETLRTVAVMDAEGFGLDK